MAEASIPPASPPSDNAADNPSRPPPSGPPCQPPLARHDSRILDLAFAMDTTGSMSSYIRSARDNVRHIVEELVATEVSDVRMALVEYRDHPPQEFTFVTRVNDFSNRVADMRRWLENSTADGGGDRPEAVADALHQVLKLSWRPEATKICVLICDAPPHGLHPAGDGFPNGCPLGLDPMDVAHKLAEKTVTLYVAGCEPAIVPYKDFFAALAYATGGQYVPLKAASALTPVIIGGAREELSLQQWMEEVNAKVRQEVEAQGQGNVDVEKLSLHVMSDLRSKGARPRHLTLNSCSLAAPSKCVATMSECGDMDSVRGMFKKLEISHRPATASEPLAPLAPSRHAPIVPSRAGRVHVGRMASPVCLTRLTPGRAPHLGDSLHDALPTGDVYETTESEISLAQAQRMVKKAMRHSKVTL